MADQASEVVPENNVVENGAEAPEVAEKPTDLSKSAPAEGANPDEASRDSAVDDDNSKSSFEEGEGEGEGEGDDDTVEKSDDYEDSKDATPNEDSTDQPPTVVDGQPDTNGNDRKRVSDANEGEADDADTPAVKKAKTDEEVTATEDAQAVAE